MERDADEAIADQEIRGIAHARRQLGEAAPERKRGAEGAGGEAAGPQAVEHAELVLGIADALGDTERAREGLDRVRREARRQRAR